MGIKNTQLSSNSVSRKTNCLFRDLWYCYVQCHIHVSSSVGNDNSDDDRLKYDDVGCDIKVQMKVTGGKGFPSFVSDKLFISSSFDALFPPKKKKRTTDSKLFFYFLSRSSFILFSLCPRAS